MSNNAPVTAPADTANVDPQTYKDDAHEAAVIGRWMARFVYLWVSVTQVILGIAFVLELFGASPNSSFSSWIYRSAASAMQPFRGMFNPDVLNIANGGNAQPVFDASLLVGMLFYAVLAGAFHALINWLTHQIRKIEAQRLEIQREQTYMAASRQAGLASTQERIADEHDQQRRAAEQQAAQPKPQPQPPQTNIEYNEYSLTQNVDETDYGR